MDGSGKCERSEEVDRGDERSHVFFFISSLWRRAGVVRIVQSVVVQWGCSRRIAVHSLFDHIASDIMNMSRRLNNSAGSEVVTPWPPIPRGPCGSPNRRPTH